MADNVTIDEGADKAIAADDVSSVWYQRVKLDGGGDGATTPILAGAGTAASALRVTTASDDPSLKAEDAAHSSGDSGVMALAVRKDTAAALAGTDGDYAPLEVDANGRLHVIEPSAAGAASSLSTITGHVDGIETLLTTIDGRVDGLEGSATTIAGAIKAEDAVHGSGDSGVMALAVRKDTAAALAGADGDYAPLEVDANGRLHVIEPSASGAATSLALLDDAVKADDAAFTVATDKVLMVGAIVDDDSTDAADEGDAVAVRATKERRLRTVMAHESSSMQAGNDEVTPKFAVIAASSSGDNTLVAAVASKKIRVLAYTLVANAAVNAKFQSATAGDITGLLYLAANTGASPGFCPVGHFQTAANEDLQLNLSGAIAVGGHLTYIEVD